MTADKHCVNAENVNPNLKKMKFVLVGPNTLRAKDLEIELSKGIPKPFKRVINATIGDSHAMGQVPMTYIRQVLALVTLPRLMSSPEFPEDVKRRAGYILDACRNQSIGCYSHPLGMDIVRQHVADYIHKRDGFPADFQNIILTAGATEGIKFLLKIFVNEINGRKTGVLTPVPQYPLYGSVLTEYGMEKVDYFLNEEDNWNIEISELRRVVRKSRNHCNPRAIVIINPGNPTGQVLPRSNIVEIIKFAYEEKLFIIADEVYQHNIWGNDSKFHSFKKVMSEMGLPYSNMELVSFMSGSKGYMGECGVRGGYIELLNVHNEVRTSIHKTIFASLCPSVYGQALIDCVANPPQEGEPSYERYVKEKTEILDSLKSKAKIVPEILNSVKGLKCNPIQGAMYAYPRIKLPPKAIKAAQKAGLEPDTFYSCELVERYGVCVIPGENCGQLPGTYHFRTTILPPGDLLKDMLQKLVKFHREFVKQYD